MEGLERDISSAMTNSAWRGPFYREGVGCRAAGAAHWARRAVPVPGRPAANPHWGCRLRAPSRSADPRRSHGVASRSRSAHAARAPRTAAFDGSQGSPSFRRVARPGLSLRLRSKAHRNRLRSGCAHITVAYRAHVPDTHGDARYALRRTNCRASGLPAEMILPCAQAHGGANRSLRLAPAG